MPQKVDQPVSFFSTKTRLATMPRTGHSNPCIAHSHWHPRVSRAAGTPRIPISGERVGVGAVASQQKKTAMQEVVVHRASPPLGVGGRGGVMMISLCFQFGPKQKIETLVHEHEWRRNCFLKTGHDSRNKVPSFCVAMVSSKYQCTYYAGTDLGGSVISRFITFCKIPWDQGRVLGCRRPGRSMPLATAFWKQCWG